MIELGSPARNAVDHLGREHVRAFVPHDFLKRRRQELVRAHEVERPDHTVLAVAVERRRCEVQRDVRRIRPIEEPRRQTMVAREREPVPSRVVRHVAPARVPAEAPQ
jgi:hypothetical protein